MGIVLATFTIVGGLLAIYQLPVVSHFLGDLFYRLPGVVHSEIQNPCLAATTATLLLVQNRPARLRYCVRPIATPNELRELYEIDAVAYGEADIGFELFQRWWLAHDTGLYALFAQEDQILGAIGIWPTTKAFYIALSKGMASEKDLSSDVIKKAARSYCKYWYISGIVLKEKSRRTTLAAMLLHQAINQWTLDHDIDFPVNLYAIAYSRPGEQMLARFDFRIVLPAQLSKDGYPLFQRSLARGEFKSLISKLGNP